MSFPNAELYNELRAIAKRFMSRERRDHTLSPTDLFHEAYTRLGPILSATSTGAKGPGEATSGAETLPALFTITMRRVLIDHARKRSRRIRKLTRLAVPSQTLNSFGCATSEEDRADQILVLDTALKRLAIDYPVHAKIVEYKFFGGMTFLQCAKNLDIGEATVHRYWNFARAWINREMHRIDTGLAIEIDRAED